MKRNAILLGLFFVVGIESRPAVAAAQTKTDPAKSDATIVKTDPLTNDRRLDRRIDYRCQKTKISDILTELKAHTSARLVAKENCANLTLHITNAPLRDIMDSLAVLYYRGVWKLEGDKWILSRRKSLAALEFNPKNSEEAEQWARGRAIKDAADKLPPDLKQRFASASIFSPSASGVSLSELPQDMQNLVKSVYQYTRQHEAESAAERNQLPETLPDCHLWMKVSGYSGSWDNRNATTHEIVLDFGASSGAADRVQARAHFVDKPGTDPDYSVVTDEERAALEQQDKASALTEYEEPKKSREKALTEDKRLSQPITLTMNRVSFLQAIQILARVANLSVATRAPSLDDNLQTFHFDKTPLHQALDQIAAAYGVKTDGYGKLAAAAAPEPDYTVLSQKRPGFTVKYDGSKTIKPHSTDPTLIEWAWRKSGMFLFVTVAPEQREAYAQAKQKAAQSTSDNGAKLLPAK